MWEFGNNVAQPRGQSIGNHLEMIEISLPMSFEEEFQQRPADVEVQVEGSIDKFELAYAAIQQRLQLGQESRQRNLANRNVQ